MPWSFIDTVSTSLEQKLLQSHLGIPTELKIKVECLSMPSFLATVLRFVTR